MIADNSAKRVATGRKFHRGCLVCHGNRADALCAAAINRGYGMSRYRWPMHFGFLNNDCLWVLDETQLMGVGVETSAQLDGFRHAQNASAQPDCRTWWMSATLNDAQLATVDHPRPDGRWPAIKLENEDLPA